MASTIFLEKDLTPLIDHHIAVLERFGITDEAPFCIAYFSLKEQNHIDSIDMFHKILRRADALFQIKDSFVILLPGTDWNGATELLSGIQNFLDQIPEDNIVAFPDDGTNAKVLLRKLENLIEDNSKKKFTLLIL